MVLMRASYLQVQEQAKAQMQQTVARLTDACWDKCIGTPGGLSGTQPPFLVLVNSFSSH